MAARSQTNTTRCDFSERTIGIDQLLLFLDNGRRPRQRPITSGGSMAVHPSADIGTGAGSAWGQKSADSVWLVARSATQHAGIAR